MIWNAIMQLIYILEEILWMSGILQMKFTKDRKHLVMAGCVFWSFMILEVCVGFGNNAPFIELLISILVIALIFNGKLFETIIKFLFTMFFTNFFGAPIRVALHILERHTQNARLNKYEEIIYECIFLYDFSWLSTSSTK